MRIKQQYNVYQTYVLYIEHIQDQPAALLLDLLGYQHNDKTTQICNKHMYRIPPNTSGWLQPYDIVLLGSVKQM